MPLFKQQTKDKLYYNQYHYKAAFDEFGMYLWQKRHRTLQQYKMWVNDYLTYRTSLTSWKEAHKQQLTNDIKSINYVSIGKFINWVVLNDSKIKIRTDYNSCSVFSNDKELLTELEEFFPYNVKYSVVSVEERPQGILLFKQEPTHKYRIYFKRKLITVDQHRELVEFFDKYPTIYPSNGLKTTLYSPQSWRRSRLNATFVEYDNESEFMIVALNFVDLIDKQYTCKKRT